MAKKKRMTSREKQELAAAKKRLQEKGLLPPNKPRLNRRKFINEVVDEWGNREPCLEWDLYLMRAAFYMMGHGDERGISLEAVGAAKVLKLAIRLYEIQMELKEEGKDKYMADELREYIKDIVNA